MTPNNERDGGAVRVTYNVTSFLVTIECLPVLGWRVRTYNYFDRYCEFPINDEFTPFGPILTDEPVSLWEKFLDWLIALLAEDAEHASKEGK